MWDYLVCGILGLFLGILLCLSMWHIHCNKQEAREEDILNNPELWCYENCKLYEEVDSQYKDPDDVWKVMDSKHYCHNCPVYIALMRR